MPANTFTLHHGDCFDVLKTISDNSINSVVCDPPYELGFVGRTWDATGIAYNVDLWRECLRVLRPGGHLLSFGGSRTYHRMACAIENAGFDIPDQCVWLSRSLLLLRQGFTGRQRYGQQSSDREAASVDAPSCAPSSRPKAARS